MKNCLCSLYSSPLQSLASVQERMTHADEIEKTLKKIAVGNWRVLYRCESCGTLWAEEFPYSEQHGGGCPCFYQMECQDPEAWLKTAPYLTMELRTFEEDRAFLSFLLKDEVGPEKCRTSDCLSKKVKLSIFCALHHFENLKKKTVPQSVKTQLGII